MTTTNDDRNEQKKNRKGESHRLFFPIEHRKQTALT